MVKIKLKSFDGNIQECEIEAAKMSHIIKHMIDDNGYDMLCDNPVIPLENEAITDEVLKKLIQYMEHYYNDPLPDNDVEEHKERRDKELTHWDKTFIDVDDRSFLYDIIEAANYLDINGLIEVSAKYICSKIRGKTCEEVRDILNIRNDFTPDEEEAIHKENKWINARHEH